MFVIVGRQYFKKWRNSLRYPISGIREGAQRSLLGRASVSGRLSWCALEAYHLCKNRSASQLRAVEFISQRTGKNSIFAASPVCSRFLQRWLGHGDEAKGVLHIFSSLPSGNTKYSLFVYPVPAPKKTKRFKALRRWFLAHKELEAQ